MVSCIKAYNNITTMQISTPTSIDDLLSKAYQIAGLTIGQAAQMAHQEIPERLLHNKGWIVQLIEQLLGAEAGSEAKPDFPLLGVELKTIPLNSAGQPLESTYVSTVPFHNITGLSWQNSVVWQKLQRVLWIPIIGDRTLPFTQRIIGTPLLWEPSSHHASILQNDWEEHIEKIALGLLDQLKSSDGIYLQVRPKAADSHALCTTFDAEGAIVQTLPRGFYLRTGFTREIIEQFYSY